MTEMFLDTPRLLLATASLSLAAALAWAVLRRLEPSSPRIHRLVWLAVLLNGIVFWRMPVELAVLSPDASTSTRFSADDPFQYAASNDLDGRWQSMQLSDWAAAPIQVAGAENKAGLESSSLSSSFEDPGGRSATTFRQILILGWIIGALGVLAVLSRRYLAVYSALGDAYPAENQWQHELDQVTRRFGVQGQLPLKTHPALGPILMVTPIRSAIVVPHTVWSELSRAQRVAILNHEVAHLVRRDIWLSLAATLLTVVHWFNPLAWMALARFNAAAEWACDDFAGKPNSKERIGFAQALLTLSAGKPVSLVGTSAVHSQNIATRVKRLLSERPGAESASRIVAVGCLVLAIAFCGCFKLRLVAATPTGKSSVVVQESDEDLRDQIKALAEQVQGDDDLTRRFKSSLETPAGIVALINRIGVLQDELRQEATRNIVTDFFREHVKGDFVTELTREISIAKSDIENIDSALQKLRAMMVGDSDADQMLQRFLENPNAASVLYFSEFRSEMRPDRDKVMERLGQFIAGDGNGNYVVRESVKDEFVAQAKPFLEMDKFTKPMQQELQFWADEVVPRDELHQRIKEGLARPGAAEIMLSRIKGDRPPREKIERYFQSLEALLVDSPDGLVIAEGQRETVEQAVAMADLHRRKMEMLRQPIQEIAHAIKERGEAERVAKKLLLSEFGLSLVVEDIDVGMSSTEAIVNRIKTEALQEVAPDELKVRDDRQQEVMNFAREMLQNTRRIRRQTMILDEPIGQVEDRQLQAVCDSLEGRMVLIDLIRTHAEQLDFAAWDQWVEAVFVESDNGVRIREGMRDEITSIIEDAKRIGQELKKDDF